MKEEKTRPCGMARGARNSREGVHMKTKTYSAVSYSALMRPRQSSVRDEVTVRHERHSEAAGLAERSPGQSARAVRQARKIGGRPRTTGEGGDGAEHRHRKVEGRAERARTARRGEQRNAEVANNARNDGRYSVDKGRGGEHFSEQL
eukprot:scaffold172373_cov31-Tisochrysis_lutea.AAC.5